MNNSRIIGTYTRGEKGPLLFITAGVHGNEPSGVNALKKVFRQLEVVKPTIRGTIVGVKGNTNALQKNVRYIDEDLNRTWTEDNISNKKTESSEQKEMEEIIAILKDFPEDEFTHRYFMDCHTTSSDSLPYVSVQLVNDNNEWAHKFPTYIVQGFSDIVYGAIDHYLSRIGITGFTFEAGQHESLTSEENHEGIIWLALKEACNLELKAIPGYPECIENFSKKNAPDQKTFKIIYRHGLEETDIFMMQPGYKNFQEIKKGELLAIQNGKEITSDWNARIFMPLYQSQGNDGFFVIQEVD
ncbi:succinylglutamate desuccinylase/aspartoacylase family protein [Gillisia sp. M10.2A]|uniref:Succinylglutamate desuccinylase/aspartoacylase family protein n=1 Tax=Gillisia lutea TaxID=2909668 RepID=A0ABS9EIG2_9FLAO|nr:succinylglutamate desuccinylase/aspartoacylase family protein [Gillisia lutea]MCF4101654.1 succinylglutamate desuccinylase/aspartoacylase family protein [Gillisia lutea]